MVNEVVPRLITHGKVPRPGIGITVLDEERSARLGIAGVVIERVMPNSEAERAGLVGIDYANRLLGDVIVAVNGEAVSDLEDFVRLLQVHEIGQEITLEVRRGDALRTVAVVIMDIS